MASRRQAVPEVTPRRAVDPDSQRVAATRARLLDAAEQLFLEQDPAGVSIRTINAAAGLNPGAVHYHFGSRQALVLALLKDRLTARLDVWRHLGELEEVADVRVRDVVALAVDPLLDLANGSERDRLWVRLLAAAVRDDPASTFARATFSPRRWEVLLTRALPALDPGVVRARWRLAVLLLLDVVVVGGQRDVLIDFLTGGLTAG